MLAMSLEGVGLRYAPWLRPGKGSDVLSGVSFDVRKGETLGVIGKNGSGKSTLMQILAGIVSPDTGKVNCYVDRVQLLSLQLGFIQELTGRENVILSAMLLGMRKRDIERRMGEVVDFSGLGEFIDRPIKTYSAGMRARLGFAVSVQADPDVLLIDEAFSVGDAEFRKKSRAVIESRMSTNKSFVLVSHSENMLKEYCIRTLWMENGLVKMLGDTASVVSAYTQIR